MKWLWQKMKKERREDHVQAQQRLTLHEKEFRDFQRRVELLEAEYGVMTARRRRKRETER